MLRPILTASAFLLAATPAAASTYSATLAARTDARIIGHDIIWNCGGGTCRGATEESRPAVLCQSLARQAGKVDSFLADNRAFSADELARCNSAAKATTGKSLAAQ